MKSTLTLLTPLLLLVAHVAAHGYVAILGVDGTPFDGDEPTEDGEPTKPSVIRRISTIDPVKGAANPFLNCGQNATAAALIAPTSAGDALTFTWEAGGGEGWPHNIGPLMFYLANCGAAACDQFNASAAQWFKIAQVGLMSDDVTWYQSNIMAGGPANVTLPANIAPGNYIIRHEIIALHLANEMGGAEFYPSCSQLNITGGGAGAPAPAELVALPGAYADDDPGIYVPDIFNGPITDYQFPGPPIAAFVAGADATAPPSAAPTPTGTTKASAPSGTAAAGQPTATPGSSSSVAAGKCRLVQQPGPALARRHLGFSRALRRLLRFESF